MFTLLLAVSCLFQDVTYSGYIQGSLVDMDIRSESFAELLRKLVHQENMRKRYEILLGIGSMLLAGSVAAYILLQELRQSPASKADPLSWRDVTTSRQQADLPKALRQADEVLAKNPRDDEGLYRKGEILVMLGDRAGARASFEQAYKIFPHDGYKKAFDALNVSEAELNVAPREAM